MSPRTLDAAALGAGHALTAIADVLAAQSSLEDGLALLGWAPPPGVYEVSAFAIDVGDVTQALAAVTGSTAADQANQTLMDERYAALLVAVGEAIAHITATAQGLPAALTSAGDWVQKTAIETELPVRLLDFLTVTLLGSSPPALTALTLLGVVELRQYPQDDTIYQVSHVRAEVHWERLGPLLSRPQDLFTEVYGWNTASFDTEQLLTNLGLLLQALGGRVLVRDLPADVAVTLTPGAGATAPPQLLVTVPGSAVPPVKEINLSVHGLPATTPGGPDAGMELVPVVQGSLSDRFPLSGPLSFGFDTTLDLSDGVGLGLRPGGFTMRSGLLDATPGALSGALGLQLFIDAPAGTPFTLLSVAGGITISLAGAKIEVGADIDGASLDPYLALSLTGAHVAISTADADGFLQQVLPSPAGADFSLTARASQRHGVHIDGSGSLEAHIAIHQVLGPVTLSDLHVELTPASSGITLGAGLSASLVIGPLAVAVQDMGLTGTLGFTAGNFGRLGLGAGFKPPTGASLAVSADVVTGGGFIAFDQAHSQYAGVLALALETLSVTAIGLVQTKDASGAPLPGGYSLLVVIAVTLPPIELGFGFSLNGVGGLLGLNRTTNISALRAGVKTGALQSILFPPNPVANAPHIVQSLQTLLPAAPGRFLVGPMVQIDWGSPATILSAELGVFVELPAPVRVTLLGRLSVGLPQNDTLAVVVLNLDAVGAVDFGQGLVSLDATLFGSRIAEFPLTGDMALRAGWKASRDFVLSIGGFHPAFTPPPGFPTLSRLALDASASTTLKLRLEAYLAITSNTVQFGAHAELSVQAGPVGLAGDLSFDALIHLAPFGLEVDFNAALTLAVSGQQLLGVSVAGRLSGPGPWQISGHASFTFMMVKAQVSFAATFGKALPPAPPAPVNVLGLVAGELSNPSNWGAAPPGQALVSLLGGPPDAGQLRAHPLGSLSFHQRVAPLGVALQTYGSAAITGPATLAITTVTYGQAPVAPAAVIDDYFAPGQFFTLTDAERLTQPEFVSYQAGIVLPAPDPLLDSVGAGAPASTAYTTYVIDSSGQSQAGGDHTMTAADALASAATSAAAQAPGPGYPGPSLGIAIAAQAAGGS